MTRPRNCASEYGSPKSTMEIATRGSRCVFLPLSEDASVQIMRRSLSRAIQTGALCGEPSGIRVAKCAKLGRSTSFLISSESEMPMRWPPDSGPGHSGSVAAPCILPAVNHDGAFLHHPLYVVQYHIDVDERVAFHRYQVGKIGRCDRAQLLFFAQQLRAIGGCGAQGLLRRHAGFYEPAELACVLAEH